MKKSLWFYNDLAFGGGAEVVLQNVANYLVGHGYKVTITTDDEMTRLSSPYSRRIRYYCQNYPSAKGRTGIQYCVWRVKRQLYKKIVIPHYKRKQYDVLIAFKDGPCALKVSTMNAEKKLVWVHTDYATFHWTKYLFTSDGQERQCLKRFSKVVCVSEAARSGVKEVVGDLENLTVAYNPINCAEIQKKAKAPAPLIRDEYPLFVSVGRLDPVKQYDLLLTACRNLQNTYRFQTWIIGGGREYEHLKKRVQEEGIFSVKLLGEQENPFPLLGQADCYICCSKSECHPIAVQEATALGIPIISTAFPAAREVVEPDTGLIVDNSTQALQNAMEAVLRNPHILTAWKEGLAARFSAEAMWEDRMQRIVDIIEGV